MPLPQSISTSQLYRLIGTDSCPATLALRLTEDFNDDPRLVPGSLRFAFDDIDRISTEFVRQKLVVLCQKGLNISQGVAALLRTSGLEAEFLEGGHFAWRDTGLPMVFAQAIPVVPGQSASLWVTRHRPKVDRLACPWLIRRFVDPQAKFLFVEPSQVTKVADRFGATPFDIEAVAFSHRGEKCTFDTMLEIFELERLLFNPSHKDALAPCFARFVTENPIRIFYKAL